jgi:hypothetical protein
VYPRFRALGSMTNVLMLQVYFDKVYLSKLLIAAE